MNINKKLLHTYLVSLTPNELVGIIEDIINSFEINESYKVDNYINNIADFKLNTKPIVISNIKDIAKEILYQPDAVDYNSITFNNISYIIGIIEYSYVRKGSDYKEYFTVYLDDQRIKS